MAYNAVTIPAKGNHTSTLIFLHGLGDQGFGWSQSFALLPLANTKMIFPHAPEKSVTLNFGMKMPAWYDIYSLDKLDKEDEVGVIESKKASMLTLYCIVDKIILSEIEAGISADRIILGGFSQGAAIALYVGLTCGFMLNSLLVFSGYLPCRHHIPATHTTLPMFVAHGNGDQVVNVKYSDLSVAYLKERGFADIQVKKYSMGHESCHQEMQDALQFMNKQLSKQ